MGAATFIFETTIDDIEIQAFIDGSPAWDRFSISGPDGRRIYDMKARRGARRQGLSELFFASSPDHYPEAPSEEANEVVRAFFDKSPAGGYEFEARTTDGSRLSGVGMLTHDIPALPEIIAPVSETDEPLEVDRNNLVIEWEPVTTNFLDDGPVTIIEYQVILDQVVPLRAEPWVDGKTRRALINLPGSATSRTVPPEFLLPDAEYEFEILAVEESGNSTISDGEFVTGE